MESRQNLHKFQSLRYFKTAPAFKNILAHNALRIFNPQACRAFDMFREQILDILINTHV